MGRFARGAGDEFTENRMFLPKRQTGSVSLGTFAVAQLRPAHWVGSPRLRRETPRPNEIEGSFGRTTDDYSAFGRGLTPR